MANGTLIAGEKVGGTERHSWLQMALGAYFFNRRRQWDIHVYPSQRIQVRPGKCLSADLCVVSGPAPAEQVFQKPPLLLIEIVLPEDGFFRVNDKIQEWLDFGVPYLWAIDPETLESEVHDERGLTFGKDGVLRIPGTPIEVPLHQLDED